MIYVDNMLQGNGAIIGDDYITVPGVGSITTNDWARLTLRDDNGGAEITEAVLRGLRKRRNALLTACDWTQVPDAPLDDAQREAWRVYRQALRDLPETGPLVPGGIVWPPADS